MSKSSSRGRRIPPEPKRRSWFNRLSPEVRVIGLVVVSVIAVVVFIAWPRPEPREPQAIAVVIPADEALHTAFQEARRTFIAAHKDMDIVLVEAGEDKMPAYEAMWREGEAKGAAAQPTPGQPSKGRAAPERETKPPGKAKPTGVDLIIGGEGYLGRWARAGLLESWDEFLAQREVRLSEAALEAGRISGKQQMLPLALELPAIGLTPPAGMVNATEVTQPESLRALADLAARLSQTARPALDARWAGVWSEAVLLATAHAAAGRDENVRMMFGRTGEALAWWRHGIETGWALKPRMGPANYTAPLLWAGQRAWFEKRGDKAQLLLPPGAQDTGTVCVVYGALLPARSQHKDAARQFAAHLLSFRSQRSLAERTGLLPAAVGPWGKLGGAQWKALEGAAARSVPLPAELRDAEVVKRFRQTALACLRGEESPQAGAAELAKLW